MIAIVAIPLLLWCICLVLGITFRNLSGKSSDRHLFVTGLIVFFASFYLFATPFMLLGWNIRYLLLSLTVFYGICFCFAVPVTLKYLRKNKKRITGQLRTFTADRTQTKYTHKDHKLKTTYVYMTHTTHNNTYI